MSGLARHAGAPIVSGAFPVAKDALEDRTISSLVMNDLIDRAKVPRPRFAYIPLLRSVRVGRRAGMVLRVTKHDARHYFHRLAVGPRWRKYFGHPPVWDSAARQGLYPRHCAVPMGMRASAGWAQCLTEVVTSRAGLSAAHRLHPDRPPPSALPVWGSIVDDVRFLEETADHETPAGPRFLDLVADEWRQVGVEPHAKKNIDGALGGELQGSMFIPQSIGSASAWTRGGCLCRHHWRCFKTPAPSSAP